MWAHTRTHDWRSNSNNRCRCRVCAPTNTDRHKVHMLRFNKLIGMEYVLRRRMQLQWPKGTSFKSESVNDVPVGWICIKRKRFDRPEGWLNIYSKIIAQKNPRRRSTYTRHCSFEYFNKYTTLGRQGRVIAPHRGFEGSSSGNGVRGIWVVVATQSSQWYRTCHVMMA